MWMLKTHDGKTVELNDKEKQDIDKFREMGMDVIALPDGSSLSPKSIAYIEPMDTYRGRNGMDVGSPRETKQIQEPKASNATVDEYRKRIRKSLEKQPKFMYQIDDGKPMDWPALRRGMIAKGYKGAEGPFWIAEALRAKGHYLYEIVGNKKYTVG